MPMILVAFRVFSPGLWWSILTLNRWGLSRDGGETIKYFSTKEKSFDDFEVSQSKRRRPPRRRSTWFRQPLGHRRRIAAAERGDRAVGDRQALDHRAAARRGAVDPARARPPATVPNIGALPICLDHCRLGRPTIPGSVAKCELELCASVPQSRTDATDRRAEIKSCLLVGRTTDRYDPQHLLVRPRQARHGGLHLAYLDREFLGRPSRASPVFDRDHVVAARPILNCVA